MKNKERFFVSVFAAFFALAAGGYYLLSKPTPTWPEALREYLGPPEYESIDSTKPINQQTRIFEIAGRTFEMPKVFIDSNLGNERILDEGINLIYILPDFTSRVDFKNRQEYERADNNRRFAHMMIEPEAPRPSFDIMIKNRREHLAKEEYVGVHNGLEFYKWYKGTKENPRYWSEMYLEKKKNGQINSFIECAPIERPSVRFPGCSHKFRDKGFIYVISYSQENYFSTWREQRRKAIEFIDSFEIKPKSYRYKKISP